MELKTFATPASLYGLASALANTKDSAVAPTIESRLQRCSRDNKWLIKVSTNLLALANNGQSEALDRGAELSQLLSWICSPLKGNSRWVTINEDAASVTAQMYSDRSSPKETNLQLLCWVVTYPLDSIELNHPVLMPFNEIGTELELAYLNLLEHVSLHTWDGNNKEVDTTSLTLRLAGIVNSLERESDLRPALTSQIKRLQGLIPDAEYSLFSDRNWVDQFIKIRNAIAHVSEKGSDLYSLSQAWERSKDLDQTRAVVRLCSYLMANEVRGNLLELPEGHAEAWADRVDEEMSWHGL